MAALGGKCTVPTLKGDVLLKIDPGTQPNEKRRMTKKGIKKLTGGGFGDQYVHLKVAVPKHLTDRQRELLEELSEEMHEQPHPKEKGFLGKISEWIDKKCHEEGMEAETEEPTPKTK
jgi:molecular chaperone DnaJ